MNHSTKNDRIKAATAALDSQKRLNYTAAAREYGIDPRTLARRYQENRFLGKKQTQLTVNASLMSKKIRYYDISIAWLIDLLIIRNLAEEIIKRPVNKN